MADRYKVLWSDDARRYLATLKKFLKKVTPQEIFKKSKYVLSEAPEKKGDIVHFPGFEYDDYYWIMLNNVIIVYDVLEKENVVLVEACFYANTGISAYVFWGIDPDED
ncbi:hypothetical protein LSG31_03015 [Fodinisporobacter ferrooxydans]|uniref:Type II toxin-antitoxin system RelE/ParE family toxin n=1 Tax=Fodinisporobacter ferrooxydans TaxID=2901836 RepID=A0ABY4CLS3_9BACL|nr:hypothetical protein LSG31_03015 [Alicyclobacillaceae bacterium MYW30-H2]